MEGVNDFTVARCLAFACCFALLWGDAMSTCTLPSAEGFAISSSPFDNINCPSFVGAALFTVSINIGACNGDGLVVRNVRIDALRTVVDLRSLCNTTSQTISFENVTFTGYVTLQFNAPHSVVMTQCTFALTRMQSHLFLNNITTPGLHQLTFNSTNGAALQSFHMQHSTMSMSCVTRCFHIVLPSRVQQFFLLENATLKWRSAWSESRAFANATSYDAMSGGVWVAGSLADQGGLENYTIRSSSLLVIGPSISLTRQTTLYEFQGFALLFVAFEAPSAFAQKRPNITVEGTSLTVDATARFPMIETYMPAIPPVAILRCVNVVGGALRLVDNRMTASEFGTPSYGGVLHYTVTPEILAALDAEYNAMAMVIEVDVWSVTLHNNTVRIASSGTINGIVSQQHLGPLAHALCFVSVASTVWARPTTRAMYRLLHVNITANDVVHQRDDLFSDGINVDNMLLALPSARATVVVVQGNSMSIASTAARTIAPIDGVSGPQEVFAHNVVVLLGNVSHVVDATVDVQIRSNTLTVAHMVPSSAVVVAGRAADPVPKYPRFGLEDGFSTQLRLAAATISIRNNNINVTVRYVEGVTISDRLVGTIAWFGCGATCINAVDDTDMPFNLTVLVANNTISVWNNARTRDEDDGLVGIAMDTTYAALRHLSSHTVTGNTINYTASSGNTTDAFVGILYRDRVRIVDPTVRTAINISSNTMFLASVNQSNMVVQSSNMRGIVAKSIAVEHWWLEVASPTADPAVSIAENNITWETSFAEANTYRPPATTLFEGILLGYIQLYEHKYLNIERNAITLLQGYFYQFTGIRVLEVSADAYQGDVLRCVANQVRTSPSGGALHTDWSTVRGIQIEAVSGTTEPPGGTQVVPLSPIIVQDNVVVVSLEPFGLTTFNDSFVLLGNPTCSISEIRVAWDGVNTSIGAVVITDQPPNPSCSTASFREAQTGCRYLHVSERSDGDKGRFIAFGRRFNGSYQAPQSVAVGATFYAVALAASDGTRILENVPRMVTVVSSCTQMGSLPSTGTPKPDSVEVTAFYLGPTQSQAFPSMNYSTVAFRGNVVRLHVTAMRRHIERPTPQATALRVSMGTGSSLIVSSMATTIDAAYATAVGLRIDAAEALSMSSSSVTVSAGWRFVNGAVYELDDLQFQYSPARGVLCSSPNVALTLLDSNVTVTGVYGGAIMGISQESAGPATLSLTGCIVTVTGYGSYVVGVNLANDRASYLTAYPPASTKFVAFVLHTSNISVTAKGLPTNRAMIAVRIEGGQKGQYLAARVSDNIVTVLLRNASAGQRVEGIAVQGWTAGANLEIARTHVNMTGMGIGTPLAIGPPAVSTFAGILLSLLFATGGGDWSVLDNTVSIQLDRLQSSVATGIRVVDVDMRPTGKRLYLSGGSVSIAALAVSSPYDGGVVHSVANGLLLQDVALDVGPLLVIAGMHITITDFASISNRGIHLRNVVQWGVGTALMRISSCRCVGRGLGTDSASLVVNGTTTATLEIENSTFITDIGSESPLSSEPSEYGDAVSIVKSTAINVMVRNSTLSITCRLQGSRAAAALHVGDSSVTKSVVISGTTMAVDAEVAATFLSVNSSIKELFVVDSTVDANRNAASGGSGSATARAQPGSGAAGIDLWRSDFKTVQLRNVTSTVSCLDVCYCANVLLSGRLNPASSGGFASTLLNIENSTFLVATRTTLVPIGALVAKTDESTDPAAPANAFACVHAGVFVVNASTPVALVVVNTSIATDRGSAAVFLNTSVKGTITMQHVTAAAQRALLQLVDVVNGSVQVESCRMQPSRNALWWLSNDACAVVSAHNATLTSLHVADAVVDFSSSPTSSRAFHWIYLNNHSLLYGDTNTSTIALALLRSSGTFRKPVVMTVLNLPPYVNPAKLASPYPAVMVSDLNLNGGTVKTSDKGPINRFYPTEVLILPTVICVWHNIQLMGMSNISMSDPVVAVPGVGWTYVVVNNSACVAPTTTTTTQLPSTTSSPNGSTTTALPSTTTGLPTSTTSPGSTTTGLPSPTAMPSSTTSPNGSTTLSPNVTDTNAPTLSTSTTTTALPPSSTAVPPQPPSTTLDACQLNASVAVSGMAHTTLLNRSSLEAASPLPQNVSASTAGSAATASGDIVDASGRYILVRLFLDNTSPEVSAAVAEYGGGGAGSWRTGVLRVVSASTQQFPGVHAIDLVLYADPVDVPLVSDTTHALALMSPLVCGPQHALVSAVMVITRQSTVISPEVVDGVTTTTGAVVAVMTLVGGSSVSAGISTARFKAYMALSGCDFDHTMELDFVTSPSRLCFGDEVGACYRGGVVGSLAILVGCGLLVSVVGVVATWARGRGNATSPRSNAMDLLRDGLLLVHFPSVLFVPFTVVVEGLTVTSTAVMVHAQDTGDYIIGVVGFASIIVMLSYGWHVIRRFCCVLVPRNPISPSTSVEEGSDIPCDDDLPQAAPRSKLMRFFQSDEKWTVADAPSKQGIGPATPVHKATDHLYKDKHLHLFNDYRVAYYPLVETTITAMFGAFEGIRLSDNDAACMSTILCVCILTFALCAFAMWLRPALVMVEAVFMHALNVVACIAAIVLLVGTLMEDEDVLAGSEVLSLVGMLLNAVKVLSSLIAVLIWVFGSGRQHLSFSSWVRRRFQHLTANKEKDTTAAAAAATSLPLFQVDESDGDNAYGGTADELVFGEDASAAAVPTASPSRALVLHDDDGDASTPAAGPTPTKEHAERDRLAGAHHMDGLYDEIQQGLRGARGAETALGKPYNATTTTTHASSSAGHLHSVAALGSSFNDATFDLLKRQQQERDGRNGHHERGGSPVDAYAGYLLGRTPSRMRISHTTTTTIELDLI